MAIFDRVVMPKDSKLSFNYPPPLPPPLLPNVCYAFGLLFNEIKI